MFCYVELREERMKASTTTVEFRKTAACPASATLLSLLCNNLPAEVAAGERAVTAAMREAGAGLKSAWRLQITGAGLGTWLANSIRSQNFPRSGESLDAAALVWSS